MVRLIKNLDPDCFEPVVLLFADGPLGNSLREWGVEVHCLPLCPTINETSRGDVRWGALFRDNKAIPALQHAWRVTRFIRAHRIDLVHTNTLKATIIGGLAATFARKPLVWWVHDRIAADYLPEAAVRGLHLIALTLPTFVVGNSQSTLQTFLPKLPRRSTVIYPGVDTEFFHCPDSDPNASSSKPRSPILIGLVGRISPTKGQDVFIRAASLVAKRYPTAQFRIIGSAMFNDGPWEDRIRRLADEHPETQIQFTGFCANVPQAMAELDIVAHASTVPEPFGQVVAEAMFCGKPVVATRAGGVPELVTEGECGWLVSPGDAEEMAERLVWLIEHPAEAAAMGQNGRRRIAGDFTVQKMARAFETIYERSLAVGVPRWWPILWPAHAACMFCATIFSAIATSRLPILIE